MRPLALVGPSWPLRGGIARTTTALAEALASRGRLAGFFVPIRQYPGVLYPGRRDTDPDACPRLPEAKACYHVLEPWTWRPLVSALRAARPAALVLPYWTAAWAPLFWFLARQELAPVIAVVHNPSDHDGRWHAGGMARLALRRCRGYLCHAGEVAGLIGRRFPGRPVAVHPLPPQRRCHADRSASRARLAVPEAAVAVLCFGLLRPYKGVDVVLEAVAALPREVPVVLLLAGEPWGTLARTLRRRLARPDLEGRVITRLEWVPETEVATWFAAADAAVLPYRSATGSAVAAQSLAWGLPVIGSAVGGIAEVIEDRVSGLLVPPGDSRALAAALASITDSAARARLAEGARAASSRWTWASYAAALEAMAADVAAACGGEAGRG